jgi:hypothetical protein
MNQIGSQGGRGSECCRNQPPRLVYSNVARRPCRTWPYGEDNLSICPGSLGELEWDLTFRSTHTFTVALYSCRAK